MNQREVNSNGLFARRDNSGQVTWGRLTPGKGASLFYELITATGRARQGPPLKTRVA